VSQLAIAFLTFGTVVVTLITTIMTNRKANTTNALVNGVHNAVIARVDQLTETLVKADVAVPPDAPKGNNNAV
jgi:hypothetical protein